MSSQPVQDIEAALREMQDLAGGGNPSAGKSKRTAVDKTVEKKKMRNATQPDTVVEPRKAFNPYYLAAALGFIVDCNDCATFFALGADLAVFKCRAAA